MKNKFLLKITENFNFLQLGGKKSISLHGHVFEMFFKYTHVLSNSLRKYVIK